MLEKVRNPQRAKSFVIYILFGMICLTFVFIGIVPDRGGGIQGLGTAATVNDVVISSSDFQERVNSMENQMAGRNQAMPAAQRQFYSRLIRQSALQQLVNNELVYQSAQAVGVLPTTSATRNFIVNNIPIFQEGGRFARERYNQYLEYRHTTASDFEDQIRHDVVVGEMRDLFTSAWAAPELVARLEDEGRSTKLNLDFVKIDDNSFAGGEVSANDIAQYLTKPENSTRVKMYYDTHKDEFSTPEEVHARHILIKNATEGSLKKIKEIQAEAATGDFSKLAEKYSEDEGSAKRGGDLNFFRRGAMVKEFEDVAFSLPIGKISDPVKTSFGYHLIKVEGRHAPETKTFDQAKDIIAKKFIAEDRKNTFLAGIPEKLKNPKALEEFLAANKLKWQETGDFTVAQNYVPKVDAGEEALMAGLSLKSEGQIYGQLLRAGSVSYIIKLKKRSTETAAKAADTRNAQMRTGGGGMEALSMWADDLKKTANIKINDSLMN